MQNVRIITAKVRWGDRTPAMICARGDILEGYGSYRESVAFCYLQTSSTRPPARLEFPRWMLDDGILERLRRSCQKRP